MITIVMIIGMMEIMVMMMIMIMIIVSIMVVAFILMIVLTKSKNVIVNTRFCDKQTYQYDMIAVEFISFRSRSTNLNAQGSYRRTHLREVGALVK